MFYRCRLNLNMYNIVHYLLIGYQFVSWKIIQQIGYRYICPSVSDNYNVVALGCVQSNIALGKYCCKH